ncbi:Phasin [Rhizobium sp. PDO1-076]|uniref:phasin family protein n=1 Tax=Rhizobium sp. PDO1-076 TaxID=1125979 RepID=UPI00024E30D5|nr:phasin family protein [Rhizobium sp. PDO1-076]EHS50916.1 Phasin [Rhizobium sp. PDO1-076]
MINFDDANKKGKEAMEGMLKNYSEVTKGFQAIAAEATDYSKKSFQDVASFMESLTGVKSMEAAFELQTSFMKSSYEGFIAEATKMGEMYSELAKTVYKPYEAPLGKSIVPFSTAA